MTDGAAKREKVIAKLADVTKTPAWAVRELFDEFGLVAIDPAIVAAAADGDPDAKGALVEIVVAQIAR
jgi:hypothetical protein